MGTIEDIMNKYKLGKENVFIILSASNMSGENVPTVVTYFRSYKKEMEDPKIDATSKAHILYNALRGARASIAYAKSGKAGGSKIYGDDFRPKVLMTKPPIIKYDDDGNAIGPISYAIPFRGPIKKKLYDSEGYLIKEEREESSKRETAKDIKPKYYYLSMNFEDQGKVPTSGPGIISIKNSNGFDTTSGSKCGRTEYTKFNGLGFDSPPSYDHQFENMHNNIPYIVLTVDSLIHGSNKQSPVYNDSGVIIAYKKVIGKKNVSLTTVKNGVAISKEPLNNIGNVLNATANMIVSYHDVAPVICKKLMDIYNSDSNVQKLYKYIKDKRNNRLIKDEHSIESEYHFNDTYGPHFHDIARDQDDKLRIQRDEDAGIYKGENRKKRKLIKPSPKRKIISIKKKSVPKKIKCTCPPKSKPKKKIVVGKRKIAIKKLIGKKVKHK